MNAIKVSSVRNRALYYLGMNNEATPPVPKLTINQANAYIFTSEKALVAKYNDLQHIEVFGVDTRWQMIEI